MKDKKTLKIASIIVAVLIAIVCITKILAAGTVFEDGEGWISTEWGHYITTEDGELLYAKEAVISDTYLNEVEIKNELENNGFYYKTKDTSAKNSEYYNPFVFCIFQGQQLPSEGDENPTDTITPEKANYTLSLEEKKALDRTPSIQFEKAVKGRYGEFSGASYETREFKRGENGKIMGKVTKYATPNAIEKDGKKVMKFLGDGSEEDVTGAVPMSWAEAYIFANNDPNEKQEKTPAQLALWALAGVPIPEGLEGDRLNEGESGSGTNELYEKAVAFESYKAEREERGDVVKLVNPEQDYKYKFNVQGNYLIAGPVQIDYGDLKYGDAELEVMQIENFTVWGKLADSDELEDITKYVEFTDADGNLLSDMNTTSGTEDGEGAGKSFPASKKDFYIKVNYDAPIYTKVVAINSLEVSFKELDVRAIGCKISEVKVCEVQWEGNDVIWQECKEKHNFTKKEWNPYKNWNPYKTFLGYDRYGNPQYQGGYDGGYDEVPDSTERTNRNHLKENCSANKTCTMGHTNCRVTITHTKIENSPSFGVLLRGKPVEAGDAQNLFLLQKAELFWRRYKLVVLFGPENDNPPSGMTPPPVTQPPVTQPPYTPTPTPTETPTPDTHRTYIDIGGNVWVDLENTKTDGAGEQDGKMGTNKDYPRENVKVTLYYKELNDNSDNEGSLVTKDMIAKWARDKFENPKYTDKNGRYDFYQLPMDKKYYVEFTYDGMTYTTTKFLAGGDTSDYKDNPNKEVYKTNSKAEEDKDERDKFNKRFEEILGTGAKSYDKSKNETTGKTNDESTKLVYRTKTFDEKFQSRLLTTDNEKDVINRYNDDDPHESGIARPGKEEDKDKYENEDYEMTVSTRTSGLIYPFIKDNELIIFDAKDYENNKEDKLEYLKHINLGLVRREKADLAIAVDIKAGGTSIKDTQFAKLVTFRTDQEENGMMTTVTDEETDAYINYKKQYKRDEIVQDVAGTDYWWLANLDGVYGDKKNIYTDEDGLNVYVLYKIILANHSDSKSTEATITGLVDYFSKGLAIPNSQKDKANIKKIFEKYGAADVDGAYSWTDGDKKEVEWENKGTEGEYTTLKTKEGFELKIGDSGKTKAIYLVLKVEKEANQRLATGGTEGLKNITEIASYKITKDGKPAGLVDCDSAPYNATPGDKDTYEDDTDDAPVFKLNVVNNAKKIEGNVWEDLEGTKGNNIDNVKVELVEYIYKDGKIVDQVPRPGLTVTNNGDSVGVEVASNKRTQSGHYEFYVEGGNYAIKFTYGDQEMLMSKDMKYNGQDYQASKNIYVPLSKSEFYNKSAKNGDGEGIIINKAVATTSELVEYLNAKALLYVDKLNVKKSGNNDQIDWESTNWKADTSKNEASNARDLTSFRTEVIKNAIVQDNAKSDLLHKLSNEGPLDEATAKELSGFGDNPNYTHVEAISDIVVVESNDLADCSKVVNLALSKRPETDVKLEKKVTRIVLTASDKTILIDTSDSAKQSNLQKDPVEDIQTALMYLDTSAMEGATIDIYYTITVTNEAEESDKVGNYIYDGEVDGRSKDSKFIVDQAEDFGVLLDELKKVFGNAIENENSPIPIRADKIYDYVNINLDYKASDNGGEDAIWKKIYDEDDNSCNDINALQIDKDIIDIGSFKKSARRVSKVLETNDNANTVKKDTGNIYATDVLNKNKDVSIEIHLGMLLTEDTADDVDDPMVYRNAAEIIQLDTFGRRDPEIIVGNYDPYNPEDETERDSSVTGTTTIIPPTGENRAVYIVLPIISIGIVIIGIILIKKKVLKK